jgi:inorganic pyrophosphatase
VLEDESGGDEKILAVPVRKTSPYYADVDEGEDVPLIIRQQIEHFFTHYKDLEPEKWVRVGTWGDREAALKVVVEAIERAKQAKKG